MLLQRQLTLADPVLPADNLDAGDFEAYNGNYNGNLEGAGSLGKCAPYSPVLLTDSFA